MEDLDDPAVEAAARALLAEEIANVKMAVANIVRECYWRSNRSALEILYRDLSRDMLAAAERDPDDIDTWQFAYFVFSLAFDAVRASLDN